MTSYHYVYSKPKGSLLVVTTRCFLKQRVAYSANHNKVKTTRCFLQSNALYSKSNAKRVITCCDNALLSENNTLLIQPMIASRGGAVPFWRWRVCKAQKTPLFSIAVTHRPHIFYSCMSSHPKTHIFSFNLSLNAPWFEKLAFEKNTMYFTLVILQSSIEKTNHVPGSTRTMLCFKYHPKTLLFCELLALTWWPHIFLYFSLTECQKSCSNPMTPHFLSLCSHRMPQPVGGRALHPYPLHICLPPPPGIASQIWHV